MRATIDNLLNIFAIFVQIEQNKHEMHSKTRSLTSKRLTKAELENYNEIEHNDHNHQKGSHANHCLHSQISTKNGEHDSCSLSKSHSSVDMDHMMPPPTSMMHNHHNVPIFSLTTDKLLHTSHISSQPIQIQQDHSVLIAENQQR